MMDGNMLKNVSGQNITALLLDTEGAAVTTGTTTVYVTGDAGSQTSMGTATHEGNGEWSIDVTQAETNYDDIGFTWVNTGAVTVHQHVFTDKAYDAVGTAQADLDIITGAAGVVLDADAITAAKIADNAFLAVNFAAASLDGKGDWNTVVPDAAGVAPTAAEVVNEWETQSQADPTGFHVNVLEVGGTAQTANDNGADINAILVDTNEIQGKLPTNKFMGSSDGADDDGTLNTIAVDVAGLDGDAMRGTDGANTTVPDAAGVAPTAVEVRQEMDSNSTQLAAIVEDTGTTLDGRIPAALVSGRMSSDAVAVSGSTTAADNMEASALLIQVCLVDTVINGHTPLVTEFQTDTITEATADHYIGRTIVFSTGVLAQQASRITDYAAVGGIGQFTVEAMTEAPANNNQFVII